MPLNLKKIKLSINWIRVRSLGSLKILTKVSYVALIVVPIMAALWPGVKSSINRYNVLVKQSISTLDKSSTKLINASNQLSSEISKTDIEPTFKQNLIENLNSITNDSSIQLSEIKQYLDNTIINSNHLPPVFAKSFFAALFIVLAHLLYDIYAHDILKKYSLDEFKEKEIELFAKYPSAGTIRAAEFYAEMASKEVGLSYTTYPKFNHSPEELYEKNFDFINTGAHARYLVLAVRNFPAVIVSILFYSVGILLLFNIVLCQSVAVIKATGAINWLTMVCS